MDEHYFKFSTNWAGGRRLCGSCGLNYDEGAHVEISTLKPFTNYVCPTGGGAGVGHSSIHNGDGSHPELRGPRDHICACGADFVEEDREQWQISFEMMPEGGTAWCPVRRVGSKHSIGQQHAGLLELIERGEPIRNVRLVELVAKS